MAGTKHNAYIEADNGACMAIFQQELHHAERMVKINLRDARCMELYVQTPGVKHKRKQYMRAVMSHRERALRAAHRWAYFAKREKHDRRRANENAFGVE